MDHALTVVVRYKDGTEAEYEADGWTCEGFWVHIYNPLLEVPVFKTIHHDEIASIAYRHNPLERLEKLEGNE